jgi:adenosylcobinamide hydrolase
VDVFDVQSRSRREAGQELPVLVWRLARPARAIASAPHGGGIGVRRWVVNAQVPHSYARRDPDHHLGRLGVSLGLAGRGVGMLTAADVRRFDSFNDSGVSVVATVGLGNPLNAAAPDGGADSGGIESDQLVGTINLVIGVPERLSDAALVNAVATVTEAKVQALRDLGFAATGTPTDAVVILCPEEGRPSAFGGPRSRWGARIARSVHAAVLSGGRGWMADRGCE